MLDTATVGIKPGEWHTLVVELRGPDILATLDGEHTAFGTHDAIGTAKTNLGLTVAGETGGRAQEVTLPGGSRTPYNHFSEFFRPCASARPVPRTTARTFGTPPE